MSQISMFVCCDFAEFAAVSLDSLQSIGRLWAPLCQRRVMMTCGVICGTRVFSCRLLVAIITGMRHSTTSFYWRLATKESWRASDRRKSKFSSPVIVGWTVFSNFDWAYLDQAEFEAEARYSFSALIRVSWSFLSVAEIGVHQKKSASTKSCF